MKTYTMNDEAYDRIFDVVSGRGDDENFDNIAQQAERCVNAGGLAINDTITVEVPAHLTRSGQVEIVRFGKDDFEVSSL